MARLSVNLNKIALLRNSRRTGVPDVLEFARLAYEAGAQGITIHPRPDERHIRGSDVPAIAQLMIPWRPACELNIEGYPDERLFAICEAVRPEQCTLVPDGPGVLTSEEGWKLDNRDTALVNASVARLKAMGARVILFIDPDPGVIDRVPGTGADGVEIYTGSYADAFRTGDPRRCWQPAPRPPSGRPSAASSSMLGTTSTSTICRRWSRRCRASPKPRSATS